MFIALVTDVVMYSETILKFTVVVKLTTIIRNLLQSVDIFNGA